MQIFILAPLPFWVWSFKMTRTESWLGTGSSWIIHNSYTIDGIFFFQHDSREAKSNSINFVLNYNHYCTGKNIKMWHDPLQVHMFQVRDCALSHALIWSAVYFLQHEILKGWVKYVTSANHHHFFFCCTVQISKKKTKPKKQNKKETKNNQPTKKNKLKKNHISKSLFYLLFVLVRGF